MRILWSPRSAIVALASVLVITFISPASAAEQWLKLRSSHFELYTTAGEKKGREAILYFEQVRDFFSKANAQSKSSSAAPVRIIAFRSEKEYKPFRPNESAAAFYLAGFDRDYIVMQSIAAENYPVAVHEFTHLLVKHTGFEIPVWFNEGLAELYSTLKPVGKKMQIGALIPGRFQVLRQSQWLPLDTLLSVDQNSPYYNERDRVGVFYAESWALMHMLNLSKPYRPEFGKFVTAIASGMPAANAFWQVYAKTTAMVQKDLEQYLSSSSFYAMFFDIKLQKSDEEPDIGPASPLESGMVQADLFALTDKTDEAAEKYESLAKQFPKNWEPEAGLAELALRAKSIEGSRRHLARAAELGATTPRLYYEYVLILHEAGEKDAALVPILKKAVELDPDYEDAHRYLAFCLLHTEDYQGAVEHFAKVKKVKRDEAFSYYYALAYANYRLEQRDAAKKSAEAARKFARTSAQIATAEEMLRAVNQGPAAMVVQRAREQTPPGTEQAVLVPRTVSKEPAVGGQPADEQARRVARRPEVPEDARDKSEDQQAKRLVRRTDPPESPVPLPGRKPRASIQGTLQQVDCLGKIARLRVLAGQKQVALVITDPRMVTVKGSASGTLDLTCGPQKGKLVVLDYESRPDARLGTSGVVRSIEYK